ncbi:MAG: redox-regulated ATPase YchF [Candidatus Berkelbacteria bacterium]|nr:MAG: redox-regulated ATPase YchF [Candidatus Berkelbacteria bacterium]QQG51981.1 MAG: redox-regulated ATPase YchF [Candidatus Berkelbacteria bacterium]
MEIGIVGLPNVGKSSLFNALTKAGAEAQNFPFTTIEPNVGIVEVPDERLSFLTEKFKAAKTVPATIKFVDIAGLVKGASQGEGLGNKFLSHIRSVDAIAEVVRVFDDPQVTHVHGGVDPGNDISTINTELLLADLEQADRALTANQDKIKRGEKEAVRLGTLLEQAVALFNDNKPLRTNPELAKSLRDFQFLSAKPLLYVANTDEKSADVSAVETHAQNEQAKVVAINVKAEQEIVELPSGEQLEYREGLGLKSGLEEVIKAGYELLGLITFFTAGPDESRAWTIAKGTKAPQAAGKIHTDFEHGFIRAQVYTFEDIKKFGSEKAIRDAGKLRSEGKEYVMRDGDVVEFLFNV